MKHGTTTACTETCDRVIKSKQGERRHSFVVHLAKRMAERRRRGKKTERAMAWEDAGFENKFRPGAATTMLNDEDTFRSFCDHMGPVNQPAVDLKARIEEILELESLVDMTQIHVEQPQPEAVGALARRIILGIRRVESKAADIEDYLGSGLTHRLGDGHAVPSLQQVTRLAGNCEKIRVRPFEELQEMGISRAIMSFKENRSGTVFATVDRREARKLLAGMLDWVNSEITIKQAGELAMEPVERLGEILPQALGAMARDIRDAAEGKPAEESAAFVKRYAKSIAAKLREKGDDGTRWMELAANADGSADEVERCINGWLLAELG